MVGERIQYERWTLSTHLSCLLHGSNTNFSLTTFVLPRTVDTLDGILWLRNNYHETRGGVIYSSALWWWEEEEEEGV